MELKVKHNFETAHRLPFLGGKCQNIHGHSWWVEWTLSGTMDATGLVGDFSVIKKQLRTWVDDYLDHGAMLGMNDTLLDAFQKEGSKVFVFGEDARTTDLPWPTVEAVSLMLFRVATNLIPNIAVVRTEVTEKYDNKAVCKGREL